MNARQEHKLTNYLGRKVLLDAPESAAITGAIPALATALAEWNGTVTLLQTLGNRQGENLTGIAQAKAELRTLMARRALVVKNKLAPFAHVSGNAELAAKVDITLTDIMHESRDTAADDFAIVLLEAATANEPALIAGYGLTAAQIDDLESAIEGYAALLGRPLAAIKSRKATTEQLDAEFGKADELLEKIINPLVFSLELEHPDFVAAYRNLARFGAPAAGGEAEAPAPATA